MSIAPLQADIAPTGNPPARAAVSLTRVELLHILALTSCIFLSLLSFGGLRGELGVALVGALTFLCLAGLAIARSLRMVLSDVYRQLQYRGKFVIFLLACAVVIVPWMAGVGDVEVLAGILLLFLSVQGFNPLFWGRILFVCAAVVFLSIGAQSPPAGWYLACWLASFLLAARLGHLRWRLHLHKASYQGGAALIRRSFVPIVLPSALAWVGYEGFRLLALPRRGWGAFPSLSPDAPERSLELFTIDTLWHALLLLGALVAALVLLWWLDRQLRSRRRPGMEEENIGTATLRAYQEGAPADASPEQESTSGPRQKILAAFAQFARSLEPAGLGRGGSETAEVWFARLSELLNGLPGRELELFDRACYSTEPVGEDEAEEFVKRLRRNREIIEQRLDRRREEGRHP